MFARPLRRSHFGAVGRSWTPPLRLHDGDGSCRLALVGVATGRGDTLQEAADDLVFNVLNLVAAFRATGARIPGELGPPDLRVLSFLYEIGELAARGRDIRERLFGFVDETERAA
jgi:hypothetical protein